MFLPKTHKNPGWSHDCLDPDITVEKPQFNKLLYYTPQKNKSSRSKKRKFIQNVTSMYVYSINTWKKDQHLFKTMKKLSMPFFHHFSIGPTWSNFFALRWWPSVPISPGGPALVAHRIELRIVPSYRIITATVGDLDSTTAPFHTFPLHWTTPPQRLRSCCVKAVRDMWARWRWTGLGAWILGWPGFQGKLGFSMAMSPKIFTNSQKIGERFQQETDFSGIREKKIWIYYDLLLNMKLSPRVTKNLVIFFKEKWGKNWSLAGWRPLSGGVIDWDILIYIALILMHIG